MSTEDWMAHAMLSALSQRVDVSPDGSLRALFTTAVQLAILLVVRRRPRCELRHVDALPRSRTRSYP